MVPNDGRSKTLHTTETTSEAELVERLVAAADAIEDEDVRNEVYQALDAALARWAPQSLERVLRGELAPL